MKNVTARLRTITKKIFFNIALHNVREAGKQQVEEIYLYLLGG